MARPDRTSTLISGVRGRLSTASLTLRDAIGLAFTLILLLSGGGLIWLDQHATLQLLQQRVDERFDGLVSTLTQRIALQFSSADAVLDTLAMAPPFTGQGSEAEGIALAHVLSNLAETAPAVTSIVTADGTGAYMLVHRKPGADVQGRTTSAFSIRLGVTNSGETLERSLRLDAGFDVIDRRPPAPQAYDARQQPWYEMAAGVSRAVTTPLYSFGRGKHLGFTMSRRTRAEPIRVFGINIRLGSLSASLQQALAVPGEHVVVFSPDGQLLGDSDRLQTDHTLDDEASADLRPHRAWSIDRSLYAAYRHDPATRDAILTIDGQSVYASIAEFSVNGAKMVVASTVPAARYELPATRLLWWSLLVQAVVIVVAFGLVSAASRSIARPIGALAAEVERIIQFRPPGPRRATSRIRELRRLAAAIDTLDLTLGAFATYLPQVFVRAIVAGGRAPGLGGRREPIAVMFTDIDGFTSLSESLPPDELLAQLSRYFSVISHEILESGGILDKFIGDSVMAFWPLPVDAPGRPGAIGRAVLRAMRRIDDLNAEFASEGRPVLSTRVGLQAGDALVGSVGTPERMNYTVLGHVVNVASRIEQLNKDYGTRILVGGAFHDRADGDLSFRHVAACSVRGTRRPIDLYELLDGDAALSAAAE